MRNSNEQAAERKPLRRVLLVLLASVGLGLVWMGSQRLNDPEILPLHEVRLTGVFHHVTEQEAQRTVMPFLAQGFLGVDMAGIRQTFKLMPWVSAVSVRRVWPDKLEIEVVEQTPVAYWGEDALVNTQGEVFAPSVLDKQMGLPKFSGPKGLAPEMTQRLREIGNLLAPLGLKVAGLAVDERRAWRVHVADGMELLLGRSDNHERLVRFIGVYQRELAAHAGDIERVDLRYTNGMAVSMKKLPSAEQKGGEGTT